MENASKALIMAGGMLLAILILSLLIYAWSLFSEYQSSQDSLADIEDTAKFNEQFANYDREGVQGYEVLTLINKVIDYNYRKSSDVEAKGNDKYKPITIIINMGDENTRKILSKDGTLKLFTGSGNLKYTQSNTVNQLQTIINFATETETRYGGADSATRIAKSIDSIFLSQTQLDYNSSQGFSEEESWQNAIKKFNVYSTNLKVNNQSKLIGEKERVYKYYEFVQFKRGKFNSIANELKYDSITGRVYQMTFNFTGEIY